MNKGDTIPVVFGYTIGGEPIAQGDLDEIEFCIANKRYTLTGGDIVWDNDSGYYTLLIPQADTFGFDNANKYQTRLKKGTNVVSSNKRIMALGGSISNEVLE